MLKEQFPIPGTSMKRPSKAWFYYHNEIQLKCASVVPNDEQVQSACRLEGFFVLFFRSLVDVTRHINRTKYHHHLEG